MSFTPFAAPILSGLLADGDITALFSVREEIETMIGFEGALALSEARAEVIPQEAAQAIFNALSDFEPSLAKITEATARDGVLVPELVRQLREHVGDPHSACLHFGATSQDVIDTALVLRLRKCLDIYKARLESIVLMLDQMEAIHGNNALMARTRMQAALPITASNRLSAWKAPIAEALARLDEIRPRLLKLQFGGAVGTLDQLGDKGQEVAQFLARDLGLELPASPWHTDRGSLAEFAGWMSQVTGALGKIGQDISLMAQNGIDEIEITGGGGSSVMVHKHNPVKAEALVTLARFNAVQLSGMHHALIHEQERSGAAWTLEWMLLPQMCVATGAATRNTITLLQSIEWIGSAVQPD